ncbi:MAG: Bifunctional protein GlmU [Syntrophaceae bacterium PtaB.Bin038]|jgi:UDP-N-acetylglucosamine diphosphorylase/glucosamine-1-phosphate N-acetyltransferase|nr:MAG: Bifunctional protein GlmU [Syntrophaceae bacterium PtaB.Bin038]
MKTGDKTFATLILAAGKGTRMKSDLVKVLHPVAGRPMLDYVLNLAEQMGSSRIALIIGHQAELVESRYGSRGLTFVYQREQLGTGHAVLQAADAFEGYRGTILILCGDVPLLQVSTVRGLMDRHRASGATLTVLTTLLEDPFGYGRVVKDAGGNVLGIVEHRDATDDQKKIREINTGIYCAENPFLFEAVREIGNDNAQKEYYFTDIFSIARRKGVRTASVIAADPGEVMGINSPDDLARATRIVQDRLKEKLKDSR